jgi:LmbE family N-acetylglucosaminyl deacetylase
MRDTRNISISASRIGLLFFAIIASSCTDPGSNLEERLASLSAREARVLLCLAAHPDDEDGFTLAYYRHGRGMRTYTVYLTRGEGGQNAIGPELYEALGALRSRETERAAAILGTVPYFLNFPDFGYAKTAQETFARWGGRERVVERLVEAIRRFRPDVIITHHDTLTTGPRRQHGHHQAAALALWEAIPLAADSSYNSELGRPWQVKRLFVRVSDPAEGFDVAVPVGDRDPVTGRSFADIAREALRQHASQDMPRLADSLRLERTYYRLLWSVDGSRPGREDLFSGLKRDFTEEERKEAENALALARMGTRLWVQPEDSLLTPGRSVRLRFFVQRLSMPNPVLRLYCGERELGRWAFPATGQLELSVILPSDAPLTYPLERYQYAYPDPVYRPLHYEIRPAVATDQPPYWVRGRIPVAIAPPLILRAHAWQWLTEPNPQLRLALEVPDPLPALARLIIKPVGRDDTLQVSVGGLEPGRIHPLEVSLRRWAPWPEGEYAFRIWVEGQTDTLLLRARRYNIALPQTVRVGWIPGLEQGTERALRAIRARFDVLDSTMLARGELSRYTSLLIGVRAYYHRPELSRYNERILDYVRQGGHVVVLYQRPPEWNGKPWPPYPLTLSTRRVSEEDAPVEVLRPGHPLLRSPYPLGPETWQDWVQERGLYFPYPYSSLYLELLQMADTGEEPLRSGLLIAAYEKGSYLYTSLAWYRQWERYHPGALRALVNMLAYPLYR